MGQATWAELERRAGELRDFAGVIGVLTWGQETYMPPKGGGPRAAQLSAMQALVHERLADPALEALLAAAAPAARGDDARALVRNLRRERDRAVKVPARLVRELAEAQTHGVEAWRAARNEGKYELFRPWLEKLLALRREQADALGHGGERYDALLGIHEPGMDVARLEPLLGALERRLVPLVEALSSAPPPAGRFELAGKTFAEDRQWDFTVFLLREMGFDLERGRQDRSIHPFTDGIHPEDVRVTTRFQPEQPFTAIFGTLHEGGHGLYEQGLPLAHARSPVGTAASLRLHESQSRLWENLVGRSLAFWERYLPELQQAFPQELAGATPRSFFAAANRVEKSFIRVEADEVTYNLHILVRFRLELAMLRGDLAAKDLPGAWDEAYVKALGLRPRSPKEGCLQDIHWAWGELGYFPTYTLGNLYAAVLFEALDRAIGGVEARIRAGDLASIRRWLGEHVHAVGHRFDAEEIVRRATGQGLSIEPFLAYLAGKFGPLYGVKV